jgi:hypothetical protein
MGKTAKKIVAYSSILATFLAIVLIFWSEEVRYSLPTPIPKSYREVAVNQVIPVKDFIQTQTPKPIFLHFFNPACPCSKFNLSHIRSLVKKYNKEIEFYAVLQVEDKNYDISKFAEKYDLPVKAIIDYENVLAEKCGVYSTPQAVILTTHSKLYYRGNYNKSRYCTNKVTNFAQMAIDSLLLGKEPPQFGILASQSYGCELPREMEN